MGKTIKKTHIVTESLTDTKIVETLLTKYKTRIKIYQASGYSSALSKAKALTEKYPEDKVLLIIDSDIVNKNNVKEKREFIFNYVNPIINQSRFKIALINPGLEAIFYNKKTWGKNTSPVSKHSSSVKMPPALVNKCVSNLAKKNVLGGISKTKPVKDIFDFVKK